ncbi:MAG: hypothetical protein FWC19_06115 [Treponema sp.]|nr:hypothetical protein [Treponema sp.]MCL2272360.1 hypothetical protein [Treponema sp.]
MKKIFILTLSVIFLGSCANLPKHLYDSFIDDEINLKYPVILAHGILGSDKNKYSHYWGRIPDVLINNGITVFYGNTDALGSIESNAEMLKETVDMVLMITNSEKVNIIAHSKGGLDSRYFIWKYDYGDKVASLTTVSTPHYGAALADMADHLNIKRTRAAQRAFRFLEKMYGDENPDTLILISELTTDYSGVFNEIVIMDKRVYCQSYYSVMKNAFDDFNYLFTHGYIKKRRGANDGIVAEVSFIWSENITRIEGMSHTEIVDQKMKKISGQQIPEIYLDMVKKLGKLGF